MAIAGEKLSILVERGREQSVGVDFEEALELEDHVIVIGFGRVGQTVTKLLNEAGVPNVALDLNANRTAACRASGYNVFYGDAGQASVLQSVGANRAIGTVVTIDQPAVADQIDSTLQEVKADLPVLFVQGTSLM